MGLSSALLWWEEWQLRVLVLSSIFFQYVLYFSYVVRRAPILRRFRVLVWIAYITGDAVAIYALATLFNRHKQTWDGEGSVLEVLWAPVLLIHLGGQPSISAYSLEDNELWKRHTLTLVCQVTVALYVFCKWWSGGQMLLAAAILLFVVGILKFAQKPWALRKASFNSLQTSHNIALWANAQNEMHIYSLEEYVQKAKKCVLDTTSDCKDYEILGTAFMLFDTFVPYTSRAELVLQFMNYEEYHACDMLHGGLRDAHNALYTRTLSMNTPLGSASPFLLPLLALASTVLFATSNKAGHDKKDIMVTYILFSCTTMLESLLLYKLISWFVSRWYNGPNQSTKRMKILVSQYNLISFCLRKKKPTFLMKLATFTFLREFINHHCYIQDVDISFKIMGVVRQHVMHGWRRYICNTASYKRFCELRGQWAIRRHHELGWSLRKPFDESVLIWHIATDLCFYHPNTSPEGRRGEATQRSREISNYMIYLLLNHPEMLMPGTRSNIFTFASDKIEEHSDKIVKGGKGLLDTEEIFVQELLKSSEFRFEEEDMFTDARKLAKELIWLGDEEDRWILIQGVWVEMLCYSASRCRGYLHAKSLGDGGEFLSTIWLLLSFMGMETLADRYQRSEPPQEEASDEEEEATSASRSRARAYGSDAV